MILRVARSIDIFAKKKIPELSARWHKQFYSGVQVYLAAQKIKTVYNALEVPCQYSA